MWRKRRSRKRRRGVSAAFRSVAAAHDSPQLYGCQACRLFFLRYESDADAVCPRCGNEMIHMTSELRPASPEERLLLELLSQKPLAYAEKGVWVTEDGRYYVDGQAELPCLATYPEASKLAEHFLSELIAQAEEGESRPQALSPVIEKQLKRVDWDIKDVLVGSIGSQEQLNINLMDRFYYVPAKHLSRDDLPVKHIAIFQSAFTASPGIRYYGDVVKIKRVKRKYIPVRLRRNNGEEDYYLFTVREWKELKPPIAVYSDTVKKPRFTNSFLLEHCESAYELFHVHSEADYRLLCELKSMFQKTAVGESGGLIGMNDDYVITFSGDRFEFVKSDGRTYRCTAEDFQKHPRDVFQRIREMQTE